MCSDLRAHGLDAAINALGGTWQPSQFDAPCINGPISAYRDAIHIYPEIVAGNPAGGDRVVRWLLGPQRYAHAENDLVVVWDRMIDDRYPRLQVPIIESEVFCPRLAPRSGVARWVGKGIAGPVPPGTIEITRSWPSHRAELAELLASVDYVISNDPFSSVCLEATMCATPVLIDFHGWSAGVCGTWDRERVGATLTGGKGLAWSPDELDTARLQAGTVHHDYVEVATLYMSDDLHHFMEDMEAMA